MINDLSHSTIRNQYLDDPVLARDCDSFYLVKPIKHSYFFIA